jgi:hypothetical protein
MTFTAWMEKELGTCKWAVCRASAKRRERYECFLSQKAYTALAAEYEAKFGPRYVIPPDANHPNGRFLRQHHENLKRWAE